METNTYFTPPPANTYFTSAAENNPFYDLEYSLNQTIHNLDQAIDQTFKLFDQAINNSFKFLNTPIFPFDSQYNDAFRSSNKKQHNQYRVHRIHHHNGISPPPQKTMFSVGKSVLDWQGNISFAKDFNSYFDKLENYEKKHRNRSEIFSRINEGKELLNQAAPAYDSLLAIYKDVFILRHQLKKQEQSDTRDLQLQTLDAMLKQLNDCPLPTKLEKTLVANYAEKAHKLHTTLSALLKSDFEVEKNTGQKDIQTDVQVVGAVSQKHFTKNQPVAQDPQTKRAEHAKNIQFLKDELTKTIDTAIHEIKRYYDDAKADGVSLNHFENVYKLRIGFWETQKQAVKDFVYSVQQAAQQKALIADSLATDKEIFSQLDKTCSFAHLPNPPLSNNIAQIEDIAKKIIEKMMSKNITTLPISFDQLSMHVIQSPNAVQLKPLLGALEYFLLAERRNNTLILETLANEQRHFLEKGKDPIAEQYNEIIEKFKIISKDDKLNRLGCPKAYLEYNNLWDNAREFAETKRNTFRAAL